MLTNNINNPGVSQLDIELDNRRRTTIRLGSHSRYRATEYPDGTLLLEPVFTVTQDELVLHANPELEAHMEEALADPAKRVRRPLPPVKD